MMLFILCSEKCRWRGRQCVDFRGFQLTAYIVDYAVAIIDNRMRAEGGEAPSGELFCCCAEAGSTGPATAS